MVVDYPSISYLVAETDLQGNEFHCRFRCPHTGLEENVSVRVATAEPAETQAAPEPAGFLAAVQRSLVASVRGMFGGSSKPAQEPAGSSAELMADCVVQAFEQVRPQFRWRDGRWVYRDVDSRLGDFHRLLTQAPVREFYDQQILARVLLEVVKADGEIQAQERAFLEQFVPAELRSYEDAAPLTMAEMAEVSHQGQRETILLLAWATAYADQEVDASELRRLGVFAKGFMLPEKRMRELRQSARLFVVDRALAELYSRGASPPAEERESVYSLAEKIELPRGDVERLEEQFHSGQS
ncbi:MAG: TerB family tellurite resistance protein [Candidatus Eremiobacteraeota bacterium]|nr:TerB family tellurite resistance protein [Candidatus Eremiobacteraeota bacterium]